MSKLSALLSALRSVTQDEQPVERERLITDLKDRYNWRTVQAPRTWRPKEPGEELVGYYGGRTVRDGNFGQYEVIIIHVPQDGSYTLSGSMLIQLVDASLASVGDPLRVVWKGYKDLSNDRQMKMFDVLVTDGESIPEDALPRMH